jgi:hypothetical protein
MCTLSNGFYGSHSLSRTEQKHNKKRVMVERHVISTFIPAVNVLAHTLSHKAEDHDAMRHVEAAATIAMKDVESSLHRPCETSNRRGSEHTHVKPFLSSLTTNSHHRVSLSDLTMFFSETLNRESIDVRTPTFKKPYRNWHTMPFHSSWFRNYCLLARHGLRWNSKSILTAWRLSISLSGKTYTSAFRTHPSQALYQTYFSHVKSYGSMLVIKRSDSGFTELTFWRL